MPKSEQATDETKIYSLDVGQADAKLIVTPEDERILVDADEGKIVDALDKVFTQELSVDNDGQKRIDHFVATHLDGDHVLGLQYLSDAGYTLETASKPDPERYAVGDGKGHVDEDISLQVKEVLEEDHGITEEDTAYLNIGDYMRTGSTKLEILAPPSAEETEFKSPKTGRSRSIPPKRANENSLAIKVTDPLGGSTLLMGDIEDKGGHYGEDWLVRQHEDGIVDLQSNVLHPGHHGSDNATKSSYKETKNGSFLGAVDPESVVISSALRSQFDHPRDAVLERMDEENASVYWTGVHGTVEQTVSGDDIVSEAGISGLSAADVLTLKYYAKANDVTQEDIAALEEGSISAEDLPRDTPELAFKSDYFETASKAFETIRRYPKDAETLTLNRFPNAMSTEYVSVDEHGAESSVAEGNADDLSQKAQQVSRSIGAATEASLEDIREQRQKALQRLADTSPQSMSRSSQTASTTSDQSTSQIHTGTKRSGQSEESDKRGRK
ncbi:ComEC/Rec2 family competence protein [Natrinema ejinorense]|uniref:MBL fold metallo-hydrolase n=1 Tax=Natrinema ejinorense TaxID=373386 RepID=A0A2A5QPN2_9EURY|nr:MBL fold metallo-hydrolase [Natrinema ejinorense]PCR88797.1 MBL fold metallo-hydrolase [Natrinema ejinorense]